MAEAFAVMRHYKRTEALENYEKVQPFDHMPQKKKIFSSKLEVSDKDLLSDGEFERFV